MESDEPRLWLIDKLMLYQRPTSIEPEDGVLSCVRCPHLAAGRTRIVVPTSGPVGGLVAIGEAPGADEDRVGEGFVGRAGKTLQRLLNQHGLERGRDYGVANIVRCRPPENRKPTQKEIENCLEWLSRFLVHTRPRVLLLVGATAAQVFLGRELLWAHIERSRQSPVLEAKTAHPQLQTALMKWDQKENPLKAIPMPHTSGLAWNRTAPNGVRWSVIGAEQVALAYTLMRSRH